jgi:PAS domain-containing protein
MRESEAEFRTLLDHIPDGVTVVADGTIVYANQSVCEMFGYAKPSWWAPTCRETCSKTSVHRRLASSATSSNARLG